MRHASGGKSAPFSSSARLISWKQVSPVVRFLLVGVAGLITDMGVFHLMHNAGFHPYLARLVSLGVATLLTWRLNRIFTFDASGRRQSEEALRYTLVTLVAQGVNYLTFATLIAGPLTAHVSLAILIGAGVATGFSYTGHSLFSFAPQSPRSKA